jgi:hypothetical protein
VSVDYQESRSPVFFSLSLSFIPFHLENKDDEGVGRRRRRRKLFEIKNKIK